MSGNDLIVNIICVGFNSYLTLGEVVLQSALVAIKYMHLLKSLKHSLCSIAFHYPL